MIIGIDMDGVIVDTAPALLKRMNEICRLKLEMKDMTNPSSAELAWGLTSKKRLDQMGVKKPWDLYTWLCPPGFFDDLPPIEGAIETLRKLSKDHELVIITKPLEWSCCTQEKVDWLTRHLAGIPYRLVMVDSMETKGLIGADIVIDDDPRALKSLRYSTGILVRCPWNESDVRDYTEVIGSITEVIPIVERMQADLEIY